MIRLLKNILLFAVGLLAGRRARREAVPAPVAAVRKPGWKLFFKRLAMLVPVLALAGFLLAASGVIPIKASSGHWAITEWFLEFSMSRSISMHSLGITPPRLDDPAMVVEGAGHYESACRPCHGGPESRQPVIPRQMTPVPPQLTSEIPKWEPEELFYIVKHGIKFTGMPAWPALERDDEVWSVTAFLLRMPDMGEAEYRRLVYGEEAGIRQDTAGVTSAELELTAVEDAGTDEVAAPAPVPDLVAERCARCHGARGEGREVSAFPRLAGQQVDYLFASLVAYSEGERNSGIMQPIAAALTEDEMREVAEYFGRATPRPRLVEPAAEPEVVPVRARPSLVPEKRLSTGDPSAAETANGLEVAFLGIPARKVPSCVDCHGPVARIRNPFYPVLAGQYAEYLFRQLKLFKNGHRGGSAFAQIMHEVVDRLTEDEMRNVAQFYAGLGQGDLEVIESDGTSPGEMEAGEEEAGEEEAGEEEAGEEDFGEEGP